ncbi:MAG: hypothetical protein ACYTFQ_00245 [Planctomycetota bacterium]|jgi:hypothetical protein
MKVINHGELGHELYAIELDVLDTRDFLILMGYISTLDPNDTEAGRCAYEFYARIMDNLREGGVHELICMVKDIFENPDGIQAGVDKEYATLKLKAMFTSGGGATDGQLPN